MRFLVKPVKRMRVSLICLPLKICIPNGDFTWEELIMKFLVKPVKRLKVSFICIPVKICVPAVTVA